MASREMLEYTIRLVVTNNNHDIRWQKRLGVKVVQNISSMFYLCNIRCILVKVLQEKYESNLPSKVYLALYTNTS